jgi:hypothetical protein
MTHAVWVDPRYWKTPRHWQDYVKARNAYCKRNGVAAEDYKSLCDKVQTQHDAEETERRNQRSKLSMRRLREKRSSSSESESDEEEKPKKKKAKKAAAATAAAPKKNEDEEEEVLATGTVMAAASAGGGGGYFSGPPAQVSSDLLITMTGYQPQEPEQQPEPQPQEQEQEQEQQQPYYEGLPQPLSMDQLLSLCQNCYKPECDFTCRGQSCVCDDNDGFMLTVMGCGAPFCVNAFRD